ncbi:hypothetical protein L2Y96_12495 [Luteibacter aegosomaticola]|uniref:hypothetical protein n=1 Tax=Luteibacter aegosomaticola TaxID=2911538 RepID=UPI001FF8A621|nr:hypothetical protein [Luteibacter aegosomaticola]UPG88239.1 hypothetical protein L2Y96_12495 [Luteibacter aegosomaticola]
MERIRRVIARMQILHIALRPVYPTLMIHRESERKMSSPLNDSPPAESALRSRRLDRLLARLDAEGSLSLRAKAERLGVPVGALRNYADGFPMPDDVARDIEWTLHLTNGWLDGRLDSIEGPAPL